MSFQQKSFYSSLPKISISPLAKKKGIRHHKHKQHGSEDVSKKLEAKAYAGGLRDAFRRETIHHSLLALAAVWQSGEGK